MTFSTAVMQFVQHLLPQSRWARSTRSPTGVCTWAPKMSQLLRPTIIHICPHNESKRGYQWDIWHIFGIYVVWAGTIPLFLLPQNTTWARLTFQVLVRVEAAKVVIFLTRWVLFHRDLLWKWWIFPWIFYENDGFFVDFSSFFGAFHAGNGFPRLTDNPEELPPPGSSNGADPTWENPWFRALC